MTLIAAVLLLAGTLLAAAAVTIYIDNAWHNDPDWETVRIARAVSTCSRRGIAAGFTLWIAAGNTTGPALLPWLLLAGAVALISKCTAPGKLNVDGRPMP